MYNLRYHIASLAAVFLALALGLVLGGVVVQRGAIYDQREEIVKQLRADFDRLSQENSALQSELQGVTAFSAEAADQASAGRLAGKNVLVVANAGRSTGLQNVRDAVEQAGGSVAVATLEHPGLGLGDDRARAALTEAGIGEVELESLAATVAAEWRSSGSTRTVTTALEKAGVLSLDGFEPGAPIDGVVTLAVFDEEPDAGALAIAEQMGSGAGSGVGAAPRIPAVGAETLREPTGVARAAAARGLGAVDDVEVSPGRWSLVWMLSTGELAYYGQGSDSDEPFAPLVLTAPTSPS